MASKIPECSSCKTLEISKPSAVWCCECEEGFCFDCEKRHKGVRATKSHQIFPIDKYPNLPTDVLKTSQTCPEHNDRYITYCNVHECMCCVHCMLKLHKECNCMDPVEDIVRDIKNSNVLRECEESLAEIHENISTIIKDRQQNSFSLKTERKRIETEIKEIKLKVIRYLDTIEAKLLEQLSQIENSENSKIQTLITSLKTQEKEINDMKVDFLAIKEHSTELQVFMAMKNIEKQSSTKREMIDELNINGNINESFLSVDLDKTLKTIEKSIPTFGRVSLESRPLSTVLKKRKNIQAQLHVPNIRSIDNIGLGPNRSIDLKLADMYGCCFLPDGRYAVASRNERCIIVMTEDGSVDFQIDIKPDCVLDITHIPTSNTLASTTGLGRKQCINIIDIDTKKITRSIPSSTSNYGIIYKDNHLYFCANNVGLCKLNLTTEKVTTIKNISGMSSYSYIAFHQDNLYFTNRDACTVTCCSINGTTKWVFMDKKVLNWPEKLSVDRQGNVYVLGFKTNNLVVLSPDGSRHSELMSEKDGLWKPVALDIDKDNNRILITNNSRKVFLNTLT